MLARFLGHFNVSILKNLLITDVQVRQIQARIPDLLDDVSQFREPLAARVRVGREAPRAPDQCGSLRPFLVSALPRNLFSSDWARAATRGKPRGHRGALRNAAIGR